MKPKDRYAEAQQELREELKRLEKMIPKCETIEELQPNHDPALDDDKDCCKERLAAGGRKGLDMEERLRLLDKFSQKLAQNMENLEKSRQFFTQEAQNLGDVLDQENQPVNGQTLPDRGDSSQSDKQDDLSPGKCSCSENDEESSFSDSDAHCACPGTCKKNCKRADSCSCEASESSDTTSDNKTSDSDKSTCTCYCSKNESHVETFDSDTEKTEDDEFPVVTRSERFRGGLDLIKNNVSNIVKGGKMRDNSVSTRNGILDSVKPLKVTDLREGLERLKIRNRNLKDFLNSLQNPLPLMCKPTEPPRKTRSCLMTVKSRHKDSLIMALSDEYVGGGPSRKIRPAPVEITPADIWRTPEKKSKEEGIFSKQSSVIGILVILAILASQVVKSELISYLSVMKAVFMGSPPPPIVVIDEEPEFGEDFNHKYIIEPAKKLLEIMAHMWSDLFCCVGWFYQFCGKAYYLTISLVFFLLEYKVLVFIATTMVLVAAVVIQIQRVILSCSKINELSPCVRYLKSKEFAKFRNRVLSTRLFWFVVGFYGHAMLSSMDDGGWLNLIFGYFREFIRWMYLKEEYMLEDAEKDPGEEVGREASTVNFETQLVEVKEYDLFEQFDYSWIIDLLTAKLQDLLELSYSLFINIMS